MIEFPHRTRGKVDLYNVLRFSIPISNLLEVGSWNSVASTIWSLLGRNRKDELRLAFLLVDLEVSFTSTCVSLPYFSGSANIVDIDVLLRELFDKSTIRRKFGRPRHQMHMERHSWCF